MHSFPYRSTSVSQEQLTPILSHYVQVASPTTKAVFPCTVEKFLRNLIQNLQRHAEFQGLCLAGSSLRYYQVPGSREPSDIDVKTFFLGPLQEMIEKVHKAMVSSLLSIVRETHNSNASSFSTGDAFNVSSSQILTFSATHSMTLYQLQGAKKDLPLQIAAHFYQGQKPITYTINANSFFIPLTVFPGPSLGSQEARTFQLYSEQGDAQVVLAQLRQQEITLGTATFFSQKWGLFHFLFEVLHGCVIQKSDSIDNFYELADYYNISFLFEEFIKKKKIPSLRFLFYCNALLSAPTLYVPKIALLLQGLTPQIQEDDALLCSLQGQKVEELSKILSYLLPMHATDVLCKVHLGHAQCQCHMKNGAYVVVPFLTSEEQLALPQEIRITLQSSYQKALSHLLSSQDLPHKRTHAIVLALEIASIFPNIGELPLQAWLFSVQEEKRGTLLSSWILTATSAESAPPVLWNQLVLLTKSTSFSSEEELSFLQQTLIAHGINSSLSDIQIHLLAYLLHKNSTLCGSTKILYPLFHLLVNSNSNTAWELLTFMWEDDLSLTIQVSEEASHLLSEKSLQNLHATCPGIRSLHLWKCQASILPLPTAAERYGKIAGGFSSTAKAAYVKGLHDWIQNKPKRAWTIYAYIHDIPDLMQIVEESYLLQEGGRRGIPPLIQEEIAGFCRQVLLARIRYYLQKNCVRQADVLLRHLAAWKEERKLLQEAAYTLVQKYESRFWIDQKVSRQEQKERIFLYLPSTVLIAPQMLQVGSSLRTLLSSLLAQKETEEVSLLTLECLREAPWHQELDPVIWQWISSFILQMHTTPRTLAYLHVLFGKILDLTQNISSSAMAECLVSFPSQDERLLALLIPSYPHLALSYALSLGALSQDILDKVDLLSWAPEQDQKNILQVLQWQEQHQGLAPTLASCVRLHPIEKFTSFLEHFCIGSLPRWIQGLDLWITYSHLYKIPSFAKYIEESCLQLTQELVEKTQQQENILSLCLETLHVRISWHSQKNDMQQVFFLLQVLIQFGIPNKTLLHQVVQKMPKDIPNFTILADLIDPRFQELTPLLLDILKEEKSLWLFALLRWQKDQSFFSLIQKKIPSLLQNLSNLPLTWAPTIQQLFVLYLKEALDEEKSSFAYHCCASQIDNTVGQNTFPLCVSALSKTPTCWDKATEAQLEKGLQLVKAHETAQQTYLLFILQRNVVYSLPFLESLLPYLSQETYPSFIQQVRKELERVKIKNHIPSLETPLVFVLQEKVRTILVKDPQTCAVLLECALSYLSSCKQEKRRKQLVSNLRKFLSSHDSFDLTAWKTWYILYDYNPSHELLRRQVQDKESLWQEMLLLSDQAFTHFLLDHLDIFTELPYLKTLIPRVKKTPSSQEQLSLFPRLVAGLVSQAASQDEEISLVTELLWHTLVEHEEQCKLAPLIIDCIQKIHLARMQGALSHGLQDKDAQAYLCFLKLYYEDPKRLQVSPDLQQTFEKGNLSFLQNPCQLTLSLQSNLADFCIQQPNTKKGLAPLVFLLLQVVPKEQTQTLTKLHSLLLQLPWPPLSPLDVLSIHHTVKNAKVPLAPMPQGVLLKIFLDLSKQSPLPLLLAFLLSEYDKRYEPLQGLKELSQEQKALFWEDLAKQDDQALIQVLQYKETTLPFLLEGETGILRKEHVLSSEEIHHLCGYYRLAEDLHNCANTPAVRSLLEESKEKAYTRVDNHAQELAKGILDPHTQQQGLSLCKTTPIFSLYFLEVLCEQNLQLENPSWLQTVKAILLALRDTEEISTMYQEWAAHFQILLQPIVQGSSPLYARALLHLMIPHAPASELPNLFLCLRHVCFQELSQANSIQGISLPDLPENLSLYLAGLQRTFTDPAYTHLVPLMAPEQLSNLLLLHAQTSPDNGNSFAQAFIFLTDLHVQQAAPSLFTFSMALTAAHLASHPQATTELTILTRAVRCITFAKKCSWEYHHTQCMIFIRIHTQLIKRLQSHSISSPIYDASFLQETLVKAQETCLYHMHDIDFSDVLQLCGILASHIPQYGGKYTPKLRPHYVLELLDKLGDRNPTKLFIFLTGCLQTSQAAFSTALLNDVFARMEQKQKAAFSHKEQKK